MISRFLPSFPFLVSLVLLPFNIVANNEECLHVLDVVQIQDVTRSLDHFWPTMRSQVGSVMKKIADTNSKAKFGFASFQDKNLTGLSPTTSQPHMLGNSTDYCVRLDAKLSRPNTKNITKIFHELEARKDGGGGDSKEGVFDALYRVVLNPKVGWRTKTKNDKKVAKLAVIVTNGVSHLQGDARALTGKRVRPFDLTLADLKTTQYDTNYDCDKVDYPSVHQVVKLIKKKKAQVVVLAGHCGKFEEGQFIPCQDLAALGDKYHNSDGLMLWYRDQFHDANLSNVLVYALDSKMENYAEMFNKAIDDFVAKDDEAVRRDQAELQKPLKEVPDPYKKFIFRHPVPPHQRDEMMQLKAKYNDLLPVLQQTLTALPDKCFTTEKLQDLQNKFTDGIDKVKKMMILLKTIFQHLKLEW